jgi:hypothetical protein
VNELIAGDQLEGPLSGMDAHLGLTLAYEEDEVQVHTFEG